MMHVFMMHMSTILDPDAHVHDARMYVAWIYDPRSLNLMQDLDACTSDAGFFRVGRTEGRTNERTNKPILGVGYSSACSHAPTC